jgi:DNA-binding MarR family transcriptional regulator
MTGMRARDPDRGPLLGALLRLAHQAVIRQVTERLARAGFSDVLPAHFAPMQVLWDFPAGARATELAARARMTKQSMGELIEQLASRGYVDRVPDPEDGRAWLVRMTPRGRRAGRLARKTVRTVEADWSREIGASRIEALKKTLTMLLRRTGRP